MYRICDYPCKKYKTDYWDCKCFLKYGKVKDDLLIYNCLNFDKYCNIRYDK